MVNEMNNESENTEYKAEFVDDLCKEVVAFANTDGGTIFVGVDDSGKPVGLKDVDDTYTRITNSIRDGICPDVTMFVKYRLDEETKTIKISVQSGSAKPYYLKGKGLKPSGVFVRQGASKSPASQEQIRQMIKEADGDVFESMRSLEQTLHFEGAKKIFSENGVPFSLEKYTALALVKRGTDEFTNLAHIISDECPYTVKIAVFADEDNTVFTDSKEFSGSVFSQLEHSFSYLMLCNKTASTFKGIKRIDTRDYPEGALREALLNALVHRDYSYSGSIIINVNPQRTEFISLGGLLPGLSIDDITAGISQPRNRNLAEIFHRLKLIESYGTGIRKIFALYKNCRSKPAIEVTSHTFKLTLPNMNAGAASEEKAAGAEKTEKELSDQQKKIIDYLSNRETASEEEIQNLLGIKRTRAYLVTKELADSGLIEIIGRGKDKVIRRAEH